MNYRIFIPYNGSNGTIKADKLESTARTLVDIIAKTISDTRFEGFNPDLIIIVRAIIPGYSGEDPIMGNARVYQSRNTFIIQYDSKEHDANIGKMELRPNGNMIKVALNLYGTWPFKDLKTEKKVMGEVRQQVKKSGLVKVLQNN